MTIIVFIIGDEGVQLVAKVLEVFEVLGSMKKCTSMTMIVVKEGYAVSFFSSFAFALLHSFLGVRTSRPRQACLNLIYGLCFTLLVDSFKVGMTVRACLLKTALWLALLH